MSKWQKLNKEDLLKRLGKAFYLGAAKYLQGGER